MSVLHSKCLGSAHGLGTINYDKIKERTLISYDKKAYMKRYNHEYWLKTRDDPSFKAKRKEWARRNRLRNQEKHRLESAKQRNLHADEVHARRAVNHAIRDGKLSRKPCEQCGNKNAEAHHDDYNYPLKVRWLCNNCHVEWHRNNKPIRKRKETI